MISSVFPSQNIFETLFEHCLQSSVYSGKLCTFNCQYRALFIRRALIAQLSGSSLRAWISLALGFVASEAVATLSSFFSGRIGSGWCELFTTMDSALKSLNPRASEGWASRRQIPPHLQTLNLSDKELLVKVSYEISVEDSEHFYNINSENIRNEYFDDAFE